MPLSSTTPGPVCELDTISFVMLDGESFVRVDVARSLLEYVTVRRSDAGHLEAFGHYRKAIERIASAKYDRGDYRSFANSRVVPIGPADVQRYARGILAL